MASRPTLAYREVDRGWKQFRSVVQQMAKAGTTYVEAGFVGPKAQEQHKGSSLTVAEVAMVHEFGGGNVPERSFVRSTYDKHKETYYKLFALLARKVEEGKALVESILDLVGSNMAGDIRKAIRDGLSPALSPRTIARKVARGFKDPETPLLATRQMINAVTHRVVVNGVAVVSEPKG